MYAIKGSWVGQTFALATTSDLEGRKSRIRRSKEERKAMVESFIHRFQSSNEGNFPSLNLTHKEVGGSFYTVREIVREIIQENRVLGPARHIPEGNHDDVLATNYPLGSLATEPQGLLLQQTHMLNVVSKPQEKDSVDIALHDNGHYTNGQDQELCKSASEHHTGETLEFPNVPLSYHAEYASSELSGSRLSLSGNGSHLYEVEIDTGQSVDGVRADKISDEAGKQEPARLPVCEIVHSDEELAVIGESKTQLVLPVEEVVVETFPLRPASKDIEGLARLSTEVGSLSGTLNDSETKPIELGDGRTDGVHNNSHVSFDTLITEESNSSETSISGQVSVVESELEVNGKVCQHIEGEVTIAAANVTDSLLIMDGTSVPNNCTYQIASHSGSESETSVELDDQLDNAPIVATSLEDRNKSSRKSSFREPHAVDLSETDIRRDNKPAAASSPPLDRINLQSWEKATSKQQPNPLLAVFKAFVDAFEKFWS